MQTYRRFVSYVYQYENGKKAGNRGFIKVEARGNTCSMQIALKGICKDGNGHCKVYGFKREDGLLKGSLLAECPVKAGIVQEQLVFLRNEMGRAGYGLSELSGVIFQGDDENMYGTQWDDEPMKIENFQPDEANERNQKREERMYAESQQEQKEETPQETTGEKVEQQEIQEVIQLLPEEEERTPQIEEQQAGSIELQERQEEPEGREEPQRQEIAATEPVGQNEETKEETVQKEIVAAERTEEPKEANELEKIEELKEETESEAFKEPAEQTLHAEIMVPGEQEEIEISPKVQAPGGAYTRQQETPMPQDGQMLEAMPSVQQSKEQTPDGQRHAEQQREVSADLPLENPIPAPAEPQAENPIPMSADSQAENRMPEFTESFAETQMKTEIPVLTNSQEENREEKKEDVRDKEEPLEILDTTIPVSELRRRKAAPNYIKSDIEAANVQERNGAEAREFCPFTDGVLHNCQKISLEDIRFLDPRDQGMRNNRFVQHGYQMFGHLLVAKVARNSQYILGVPGMYQQQEKFMADMFGFHNFKYARRSGSRPACFGYWYRLIYPPKLGCGNECPD